MLANSSLVIAFLKEETHVLEEQCLKVEVFSLADHKRLSGGCDFNSLNNSSSGTVAKLVHWSLIA